jgi:hypothetical protein
MAAYRIYCLDGAGHIGLADWIEAETDEQAIVEARKVRPDANKCEVWLKDRLVGKLNANGHLDPGLPYVSFAPQPRP